MGANYTYITYNTSYPPALSMQVANANVVSSTACPQVEIDLVGPSGWIPTHYKLWNINGITTSGAASWDVFLPTTTGIPSYTTVTGTLFIQEETQYVYAHFLSDSGIVSETVMSSGTIFTWTDPIIDPSMQWTASWAVQGYECASSATIRSTAYNVDIELDKDVIGDLLFSGKSFTDVKVQTDDTVEVSSSSYLGTLTANLVNNKVGIRKTLSSADKVPLIAVDLYDVGEFVTLTKYDGTEKTGLGASFTNKVTDWSWTPGTKELYFAAKSFTTYGFVTIASVSYQYNSITAGYNSTSIDLIVKVLDTQGYTVESAPITFSGISGDNIGNFSSNPVLTNVNGIATASLNLTSLGTGVYQAEVDGVSDTQSTMCVAFPANIQRSLLTQYEQISSTTTYDDVIADINVSTVAEPTGATTSGDADDVLEHDMNVIRTMLKQLKGTTNWFDDPGTYFDPLTTTSGGLETKQLTLSGIKGTTLDSHTIIIPVVDDNVGAGYDVTLSGGYLLPISTAYSTQTDRRGLPIYAANPSIDGPDEGGIYEVCGIDVIDTSTEAEFYNGSGDLIYAYFHNGVDYGGSGSTSDVYAKFYANGQPYTLSGTDPANVLFIYPRRKIFGELYEYEWLRTDFVSSWEGEVEIIQYVEDLWNFTGALDDVVDPTWTGTENFYILGGITSLEAGVNGFNNEIGNRNYTQNYYITDGDTVTDSLEDLDIAIKNAENIAALGISQRYIKELTAGISAGSLYSLPYSIIYTPDSTAGQEGSNMDVFVNGQLLSADTGVNGANADKDYGETTTSGITFRFDISQGSNIVFMVKA